MRRIPWLALSLVLGLGLALAACDGPSRGTNTQPSAVQGFQINVVASPNTVAAAPETSESTAGGCAQVQAKVFDRFHRVSTGLVHDVKGSGLGLAIVRHVAEAHRGRVELESRPDEGSVFSLWLPLAATAGEPAPLGQRWTSEA